MVLFCLQCRMYIWRKRHAAFIRHTHGMSPSVRATCLALGTGVYVTFAHDALYKKSNAGWSVIGIESLRCALCVVRCAFRAGRAGRAAWRSRGQQAPAVRLRTWEHVQLALTYRPNIPLMKHDDTAGVWHDSIVNYGTCKLL